MSDPSKLDVLLDAVYDLLSSANWFPDEDVGAVDMLVDSDAVSACQAAYDALIREQAEAAHGVVRD